MPVKIATAPSSSGDPLGVDDNYQAFVYDPIEDEWIPGSVMEQRNQERAAQNVQPPPPPANPDQPPAPPARPDVSIAPPEASDTAAKLSAATVASVAGAAPAPPVAAPDPTNDALTSDRELEAQGMTPARGGGLVDGAERTSGAQAVTDQTTQRRIDMALRAQAQSTAEAEGQSAQGQTVPADFAEKTATSGGVDTGQEWPDPYGVGATFNGPTGMRPPQDPREYAITKGEISTTSNALEDKVSDAAKAAYHSTEGIDIPVYSPAARYVKRNLQVAADAAAPYVGYVADALAAPVTATTIAANKALGTNIPLPGAATQFGIEEAPSIIPTHLGSLLTTLPVGELATGGGRLAARLARVAARDAAEHVGESETAQNAIRAVREGVTAGEEGAARLPRPGGGTAREAAAQRAVDNRNIGGAGVGEVDNRAMREAAPLTEEMRYTAEGLQLDPAALGLPTDRAGLDAAIADIRRNVGGRTGELGKLEAQRDALKDIENLDAAGAFQRIADGYANTRATNPYFQAQRDELGRIHDAMLDPEVADRFAPQALTEPPAGVTFDSITHERQMPGHNNPDLQLQAPSTPAPNQAAPTLPGTEAATGGPLRQPAPVLGSMRSDEEIFRGEQGGIQTGLDGVNTAGAERYQAGLGESAAPPVEAVREVAPAGSKATDVSELDKLLAVRQQNAAVGRSLPAVDKRIVELGKKTPYDDASIIEARAKNAAHVVPESPEMHAEWIGTLRTNGGIAHPEPGEVVPILRNREAHIVLGPPAAGKNTATANPLRKSTGSMLIDSDEAKELIPGFEKGYYAGPVHVESDKIIKQMMLDSISRGENVVMPLVGKNKDKIDELGRLLKENGYEVRLHYVDLPEDKAAERAVSRFHERNRFVDPDYVLNQVDGHPRRTFDELKGADWVSGYERKSNDVARGASPVTIESTLERPAAEASAARPGIDDAGRADLGGQGGQDAASRSAARLNPDEPIPGLAESLDPANAAAERARADVLRTQGQAAADNAAVNRPTTAAPQPPKPAPETGPYVRQPDGSTVEATAESVSAGVKRVMQRSSGLRIPTGATPDEALAIIRKSVKEARTTGGRSLFGPGTDEALIDDAINKIVLDGKVKIAHTGGRGRIAATFVAEDEEGALGKALEGAGSHRPEAGIENVGAVSEASNPLARENFDSDAAWHKANYEAQTPERRAADATRSREMLGPREVPADAAAEWQRLQQGGRGAGTPPPPPPPPPANQGAMLPGEGPNDIAPWSVPENAQKQWAALQRQGEQQRLQQGLEKAQSQKMQTPDFAPEGRGGAGGGTPRPPAGGEGQSAMPWKPGQPLGRRLLKAGADLLFGVPRSMKFGFDQSAALRQGLWDLVSHPAITVAGAPKRFLEGVDPNEVRLLRDAAARNLGESSYDSAPVAAQRAIDRNPNIASKLNPAFGRGQGKMLADFATHPAREATNIIQSIYHADGALVQQFKAFNAALLHAHPAETDRIYGRIGQRYPELKASFTDNQGNVLPGLYKAERGAKAPLSAREEQVATSILDHVPIVGRLMRAAEDAFAMFLSKQRDDVFDNWVDTYRRLTGELPSRQEANDVARWTNIKSGRGELPQNWANAFTVPFTAPKLYAAQIERLPIIAPFMLRSGEVRKQMMADWVKVFGALSASVAMASEFGLGSVDVDTSHPSADFLKIRIGNHRIDPWGGYAQMARLTARLVSGARSTSGVVYDASWRDELTNFALSKLAPTAALANDIISGHDFDHNKLHWDWDSVKKEVQNTYAPLLFQDLIQGFQDDGLRGLAISAPSFFGLSVSTYPPGVTELRAKAAQAAGYPSFREAPLSVQDTINAQPDIAKLAASQPPSQYKTAKEAAYAPIEAAQKQAEESFKAGTNDTLIQDLWHDQSQQRQGTRTALEAAFTETFSHSQKTQFDKALDGYYAEDKKRPDGSPDFEATDQARRDYLAGLPKVQQDWIADFLDVGASKQSPLRQEYFKYLDARKAAGYFDLDPKDPKYASKLAALDKANVDLDVQNWYWKHTTAADVRLNSPEAVDKALAMLADNPGRTVKANLDGIGSIGRPINGNEQAWSDSKALIQKFADSKVKFEKQEQARLIASNSPNAASYNKPWAQLTPAQQSTIHANIAKSLQTNSPQLDALLAYWGVSDTLNSQAAIAEYRKLQAKYGKDPATPTTVIKVAAGAK